MATSFKLDPHEYLTLAPGLQRVENELFLEGFAIAPWKPLALVMNRQKVYVVLSGQNKWLSITWSFSRLPATYLRPPPHPSNPAPFRDSVGLLKDWLPTSSVEARAGFNFSAVCGQEKKTGAAVKYLNVEFLNYLRSSTLRDLLPLATFPAMISNKLQLLCCGPVSNCLIIHS